MNTQRFNRDLVIGQAHIDIERDNDSADGNRSLTGICTGRIRAFNIDGDVYETHSRTFPDEQSNFLIVNSLVKLIGA